MTIRELMVSLGFEVDHNSEKQAENSIKGLKNVASKLLGAIGIVFSIRGIADLAQAAGDAEALKSQFTQVFGDVEDEAAERLNNIADDTGVLVNRMKGSFTQIAAFSKTTGLDQKESLEIADRAMQAVTDSAAFYDRSIEAVTESMRSFLKGNYEQDAALGLSATETTRNAAANELYGKSFKDLSEAEKQFTLLKMVEDANKASGALGQAARESDTWTNQLGNLQQSLVDLKAAAGSTFLKPAVSVLKVLSGLAHGAANAISGLTAENGLLTRATERYHALVKRLQPAVERMGQALSRGLDKGREIAGGLIDRLGGTENVMKILATAAAALFVVLNWNKAISGAKAFMTLLSSIGKLFNVSNMKVLGIAAAITAVALIIEDFVNFLLGNDSVFGTVFDKLGIGAENARKAIFGAFEKVRDFLLGVWDQVLPAWQAVQEALIAVWHALFEAGRAVFEALATVIETVFGWIKSFWDQWGPEVLSYFQSVWDSMGQVANDFLDIITNIANFISSVFTGDWQGAWEAVQEAFSSAWDAILEILGSAWEGITSISTIAVESLPGLLEGGWNLLKEGVSAVADALPELLEAGWNALKEAAVAAVGALPGLLAGGWDLLTSGISAVGDGLGTLLDAGWTALSNAASAAVSALPGSLSGAWDALTNGISAVGDGLGSLLDAGWNTLTSNAQAVASGFWDGISGGWNAVTDGIRGIGDGLGSLLDEGWAALKDAAGGAVDWIQEKWNGIKDFFAGIWDSITGGSDESADSVSKTGEAVAEAGESMQNAGTNLESAGEAATITGDTFVEAGNVITLSMDETSESVAENVEEIKSNMSSAWSSILSLTTSAWNSIRSAVSSSMSQMQSSVSSGIARIKASFEGMSTPASSAYQWGYDMGAQMAAGIRASAPAVASAASGVAGQVRSVLHFSRPDTGPLADADTYMPDFMKLLANGISENEGAVLEKVKGLAGDIRTLVSAATAGAATASAGTVRNMTSSVVQNVNIDNSYTGPSTEAQRGISRTMKKSAVDATTQMARALAYARG